MGPEVRTQPLQMTHSLSRAASFSGSRLPWWDEPLCHFSIPLQFSLGWRISQLSLLAPDTAGLRRDVGLDAKGRGVAVLFHSLPVTDFTPTTGTPRATGRAHSWVIQPARYPLMEFFWECYTRLKALGTAVHFFYSMLAALSHWMVSPITMAVWASVFFRRTTPCVLNAGFTFVLCS
ncbi:uncharacterized protein LOC128800969 isoform X3 [Vidua chalybeata]|uniref:uncharacterized protein LOC128800969 isoform X3 n=1 Tax=Vidua chalybeata TaxID=81927 RepID=UPI0023A79830|nr:uncharacterized protein LOC128800969 isoform X3 [Vidua chalybeata]